MEDRQTAIYPSLVNRVVIITGGSTGIGAAIVEAFSRQGAKVCFIDIQDDAGSRLASSLSNSRNLPEYYHCDLTDVESLRRTIEKIIGFHDTVDVLVNNAGNDTRHVVDDVSPEFWDQTIEVNLKHQFFATQAVLPCMRRQSRGSVINMSSIGWLIPSVKQCVYVTAKAAIVGMTRAISHEEGVHNIRVNAVLPGAVLTERQERLWLSEAYKAEIFASQAIKRLILPSEVAGLVLFLASDDSAAITNQSYVIDAGWV